MKDYSRFLKVYANVPDGLRSGIIAVVDEKTYSWNAAYLEIKNETELGERIFRQLLKTEII